MLCLWRCGSRGSISLEICKAVTLCVDTPANTHNNQNVRACQTQRSRGGRLDRKHGCITVCHRPGDSTSGVSRTVGSVAISSNDVRYRTKSNSILFPHYLPAEPMLPSPRNSGITENSAVMTKNQEPQVLAIDCPINMPMLGRRWANVGPTIGATLGQRTNVHLPQHWANVGQRLACQPYFWQLDNHRNAIFRICQRWPDVGAGGH